MIDSERNGYGTDLQDILYTFDEQAAVDSKLLADRFWDMFIADSFIGNWDRHNGNWVFLYNTETDEMKLAPVYDCGSSLYPQAEEIMMKAILDDEEERNHRIYNIPTSAVTVNNKKIRCFDLISSYEYEGCNQALKRIVPQIDMNKISNLIDETPLLTDLQ